MRRDRKEFWLKAGNDLRVYFLGPWVLVVWLTAWADPHLWRYWNMKSMANWRWFRWRWQAYAISLLGWMALGSGAFFLACWTGLLK